MSKSVEIIPWEGRRLQVSMWEHERIRSDMKKVIITHAYGDVRRVSGVDGNGIFYSTNIARISRRGVRVQYWDGKALGFLEDAARLGLIPRKRFEAIKALREKKQKKESVAYAARQILESAQAAGLVLSAAERHRLVGLTR